jgi:hypothetical protein
MTDPSVLRQIIANARARNDNECILEEGASVSSLNLKKLESMEKPFKRKTKVYGKKTTTSSQTADMFTRDTTPVDTVSATATVPSSSPVRHALDDLTNALRNVKLKSEVKAGCRTEEQFPKGTNRSKKTSLEVKDLEDAITTRTTRITKIAKSKHDPREKWLKPLTGIFESDGSSAIMIRKWEDILDPNWKLEKIAESSYAEVYKVANEEGTSVLKVMALKPPKGPGSQRETAVTVESVVSEVLIMDMMAEIPGFLEFKGAHIIEGKAPKGLTEAYEAHSLKQESFFPKPTGYHKDQLFLALELGDAGLDIEHFNIVNLAQLWDIFLRTTFAMANGEAEFRFEVSLTLL